MNIKNSEGTFCTVIKTLIVLLYANIWWGSIFVTLIDDYKFADFLISS